jgi:hypothetical protein
MSWFSNLGKYSKAIIAGVGAAATVLVTLAADPAVDSVIPKTVTQIVAAVGSVVVTVIAVWAKSNTTKKPKNWG